MPVTRITLDDGGAPTPLCPRFDAVLLLRVWAFRAARQRPAPPSAASDDVRT